MCASHKLLTHARNAPVISVLRDIHVQIKILLKVILYQKHLWKLSQTRHKQKDRHTRTNTHALTHACTYTKYRLSFIRKFKALLTVYKITCNIPLLFTQNSTNTPYIIIIICGFIILISSAYKYKSPKYQRVLTFVKIKFCLNVFDCNFLQIGRATSL